jgi:type VI secretion system secreted protein Hcp
MKKSNVCKVIAAILLIAAAILLLISCSAEPSGSTSETVSAKEDTGLSVGIIAGTTPDADSLGVSAFNGKYPVVGEYIWIRGNVQGEIKGDCTQGGDKKDMIVSYSFNDSLRIPCDDHTGLPTGQREHLAASFIHAVDRATPKLQKAACTGERVEIRVDKYRTGADGDEQKYFTLKYEDAIIVGTELFDGENGTMYEKITFTFAKVIYTYIDGNIEFADDWKY